ncbi:MAG TPA: amylo-alpha-1,6-glucosidase [Steroidobacter sp.]|uniref:amylo-alpha-1,6-glucosidase n=1 Tax=Steroidobacter sp. TaxID=1978227 RepID=UPI002EDA6AF8
MSDQNEDSNQAYYISAQASLAELRPRTLKHGDTFALFDRFGDLSSGPSSAEGLYHEDIRFLSWLRFTIEGHTPLLLSSTVQSNNAMLDADLVNPDLRCGEVIDLPKDTIHVSRMKFLWNAACYEVLAIRNFDERARKVRVGLEFDGDFKDVFEVRGFERHSQGRVRKTVCAPDHVQLVYSSLDGVPRSTEIYFSPQPFELTTQRAVFAVDIAPKQRRAIFVTVHCRTHEQAIERHPFVALRLARRELRAVTRRASTLETSSNSANDILCRSMADISMLVTDTEHGAYPYAGVPWFSTAFGRDGLITALQMLWVYPSLAKGVLQFLAATQAHSNEPARDAEPGKILHETRRGELARLGEVPFERYYGSVDATPLFVVLAGRYWQYTRDLATLRTIWPNVKQALAWIDRYGDIDGDGFVEYSRRTGSGLVNQGWKDSGDAVFHSDGTIAEAPIALCEVQGYVYLARMLAAQLAEAMGEHALATLHRDRAAQLRERFDEAFWDDQLGMYALALDREKRPCCVRSSNAGQVLLTGIAFPERAARMARVLLDREFFTGWGLRTLSNRERRFNPTSYHNGSVWPHDNALIAMGLAKYGHFAEAVHITNAILDAAARMDLRRLPELFCGMPRRRDKGPILYPVACAPQAWAAATPFGLLQACLGLEIDAGARVLRLRHPRLPASIEWLRIRRLAVGDARLDVLLRRHDADVAVNVLNKEGGVEVAVQL